MRKYLLRPRRPGDPARMRKARARHPPRPCGNADPRKPVIGHGAGFSQVIRGIFRCDPCLCDLEPSLPPGCDGSPPLRETPHHTHRRDGEASLLSPLPEGGDSAARRFCKKLLHKGASGICARKETTNDIGTRTCRVGACVERRRAENRYPEPDTGGTLLGTYVCSRRLVVVHHKQRDRMGLDYDRERQDHRPPSDRASGTRPIFRRVRPAGPERVPRGTRRQPG